MFMTSATTKGHDRVQRAAWMSRVRAPVGGHLDVRSPCCQESCGCHWSSQPPWAALVSMACAGVMVVSMVQATVKQMLPFLFCAISGDRAEVTLEAM